jgi:hypothetical protein
MQKHALIYGGIAGAILIAFFFISQPLVMKADGSFDMKTGEVIGYLSMLVSLSMIFFGIRSYRDNHLEDTITFGKAFQVGLFITLVASVIYVVGWMIYYNTSETMRNFPELYLQHMLEELKASGKSAAEIAKKELELRKNMDLYKNPAIMVAITFLEIFPVGLIIDAISALLLRKKKEAEA